MCEINKHIILVWAQNKNFCANDDDGDVDNQIVVVLCIYYRGKSTAATVLKKNTLMCSNYAKSYRFHYINIEFQTKQI